MERREIRDGQSGSSLLGHGIDPAGSRAGFADDSTAALAYTAGAATPHAGLLDDRGDTVVVDRKAFSECHFLNSLLYERLWPWIENYRRRVNAAPGDCIKFDSKCAGASLPGLTRQSMRRVSMDTRVKP